MFVDEPCPNCKSCDIPLLVVHHDKFIQPLEEACNHQSNKEYELAFNKASESTQFIEQAIGQIQNIAHQKSQGYFVVQEKDSEEAIKVAEDALKLYVNENNKSCSKNKNG
jgi:hypothetical protein